MMHRTIVALMMVTVGISAAAWSYAESLYRASTASMVALPSWSPPPRPTAVVRTTTVQSSAAPADPFAPQVAPALPAARPLPSRPMPPLATGSRPALPVPPLPGPPGTDALPGPEPPPAVAVPRFRLTGVVTGAERRAVLEGGQTAHVVKEGDQVEGWTVTRIDDGGVSLRASSGQEVRIGMEGPVSVPRPAHSPPQTPPSPAQGTTN